MQKKTDVLDHLVRFGRDQEYLDELMVASIEDGESYIAQLENDLEAEMLDYHWAQILDPNNKIVRYYFKKQGRFLRSESWENAIAAKPSEIEFETFEFQAKSREGKELLKLEITSSDEKRAAFHARMISEGFIGFRDKSKIAEITGGLSLSREQRAAELDKVIPNRSKTKADPALRLRQARKAFKERNFLEALSLYEEALDSGKEDLADILNAAKAALEISHFEKAELFANRVLLRQERNTEALVIKGSIYTAWQCFDEDLNFWELQSKENPQNALVSQCYKDMYGSSLKRSTRSVVFDLTQIGSSSLAEEFDEERKWARAKVELPIFMKGMNSRIGMKHLITSLSGGGCRIKSHGTKAIPEKFQFFFDIGKTRIMGVGTLIYEDEPGSFGIRFELMSPEHRRSVDHFVAQALKRRKA